MVKYLILMFIFFTTSVFATDYTGSGGEFGGGGASGSWGDDSSCASKYYWTSVYGSETISDTPYRAAEKMITITCELNRYKNCSPATNFVKINDRQYTFNWTYTDKFGTDRTGSQTANARDNPSFNSSCVCTADEIYSDTYKKCIPKTCPSGQHLEGDKCVNDPPPPPQPDETPDDTCDTTCKCKAELEAIKKAIEDIDLSKIESNLDKISKNTTDTNIKLDDTLKELKDINKYIQENGKDLKEIQTKIDKLNDDLTKKLDEILQQLKRPKQCNDGEFNKKICDFIDSFMLMPDAETTDETKVPIDDMGDIDWRTIAEKNYLVLPNNCPFNPVFHVPFLGAAASIIFPLDIICRGAVMLKVVLMLWASSVALRIIGETPL